MSKNFRTYHLAVKLYHHTSKLKLPRHLKDQLDRAASSIVLNLAEGSDKKSPKDQLRYFDIALGSLRETQSILDLALNVSDNLIKEADIVAAHLYRLIHYKK